MVAALRHNEHDEQWERRLALLSTAAGRLGEEQVDARDTFAKEVLSLFGGMGSFNDAAYAYSQETRTLQERLFTCAEDEVRACWKALGRPWHDIADAELLAPGDTVELIAGEVIWLGAGGESAKAPRSPLTYRVIERLGRDFDNMPLYAIAAESRRRIARHNALRAVDRG